MNISERLPRAVTVAAVGLGLLALAPAPKAEKTVCPTIDYQADEVPLLANQTPATRKISALGWWTVGLLSEKWCKRDPSSVGVERLSDGVVRLSAERRVDLTVPGNTGGAYMVSIVLAEGARGLDPTAVTEISLAEIIDTPRETLQTFAFHATKAKRAGWDIDIRTEVQGGGSVVGNTADSISYLVAEDVARKAAYIVDTADAGNLPGLSSVLGRARDQVFTNSLPLDKPTVPRAPDPAR
jgi:hypothetical protein